jgi:hypothetical protein
MYVGIMEAPIIIVYRGSWYKNAVARLVVTWMFVRGLTD